MRVVCQRVLEASVSVDQEVVGSIKKGYLLYIGFTHTDDEEVLNKMAKKIQKLRVFEDENHRLNHDIEFVKGEILAISQFTLYGSVKGNHRPSFTEAAKPDKAIQLYQDFVEKLKAFSHVETGIFGADMRISSINDGPVTINIEY